MTILTSTAQWYYIVSLYFEGRERNTHCALDMSACHPVLRQVIRDQSVVTPQSIDIPLTPLHYYIS